MYEVVYNKFLSKGRTHFRPFLAFLRSSGLQHLPDGLIIGMNHIFPKEEIVSKIEG